jgi:NAD(P)-dependent dehydrogenase (short-subunit alcohol dehydrogenase family)
MTSLSGKTALVTGASRGIGRADAVGADLSAPDGAHKLARQVRAVVGDRLDILVANAGTSKTATIEETTVEDFDKLFAVNVRAPFFLVQQLLPILGSGGCIVLVSSLAAHAVVGTLSAYAATKGAIDISLTLFIVATGLFHERSGPAFLTALTAFLTFALVAWLRALSIILVPEAD